MRQLWSLAAWASEQLGQERGWEQVVRPALRSSWFGSFALPAVDVVGGFVVWATTATATYGAVGVDLAAELPASCALDELDLLDPLRAVAWLSEDHEGATGEDLGAFLLGVRYGEGDVGIAVPGAGAFAGGPVGALHERGVGEEWVGGAECGLDVSLGDRLELPEGAVGGVLSVERGARVCA